MSRSRSTPRQTKLMQQSLRKWYAAHGRQFVWRSTRCSTYKKVLAEILLQRTRAETVASFLPTFLNRFRNWATLAAASRATLEAALRPIGLSSRRAETLHALAIEMVARRGELPATYTELVRLSGVGQYIANAILVTVHKRQAPMLDVNMARVIERCCGPRKLVDIRHDPHLRTLSRSLVRCRDSCHINWAVLDLGALVCTPRNPLCEACPLRKLCRYAQNQRRASKAVSLA